MPLIHWGEEEAQLKTYSTKARAKGGAVISLEIEVLDPWALGFIPRQMEEIRQAQAEAARKGTPAPSTRAQRRERAAPAPAIEAGRSVPLLTYRGGDE